MRVDIVYIYQTVKNSEDGQTRSRVYIEFGRYVTSVGGHRIDRDKEFLGYLLILQPARHAAEYLLLPVGE